jgi:cell division protein FtsB
MKALTSIAFVLTATISIFGYSTLGGAQDAKSSCQNIADCAQQLVDIANKLSDANLQLAKRVAALEGDVAKYKTKNDALVKILNERVDKFRVSADGKEETKEYHQQEFWNATATNPVAYTCGGKNSVLVGIDFDMLGLNGVRTPTRIKYTCRELRP